MIKFRRLARIEERRVTFKVLTDKPLEGRCNWEDNIRTNLKEISVNTGSWIDRDYWRALVNTALNLRLHNP